MHMPLNDAPHSTVLISRLWLSQVSQSWQVAAVVGSVDRRANVPAGHVLHAASLVAVHDLLST